MNITTYPTPLLFQNSQLIGGKVKMVWKIKNKRLLFYYIPEEYSLVLYRHSFKLTHVKL